MPKSRSWTVEGRKFYFSPFEKKLATHIKGKDALCNAERILIPIADRLGERLFKRRSAAFIKRHYNKHHPFLSYLEDIGP